jgi:FKBP-type peptidyl-prolyl cis-trans isomerase FkpA
MKFKLPLIAVMVGALSLSACGGGSGGGGASVSVDNPASLTITDVTIGTGATVANGMNVTITYAAYLYKNGAIDSKGTLVDPGAQPYNFTVGAGKVIPGVDIGIVGMKVGGHRLLAIPASQAYGASGSGGVPPNSGILFDMTLTAAQ